MSFIKYAIALLSITSCTIGKRIIRNAGDEVDLTPKLEGRVAVSCKTKNNQDGICVHESYCNEEHTILPGGIIEDFELRSRECKQFEWCCTNATTPPIIKTIDNECTSVDADLSCPWCVSLHKSVDIKVSSTGLFCMGSMIGSKVILTAATCIKAAQKHMLWARVPGSADPKRNYTVRYRQFHRNYNTGSHEYDFGILVLENDVNWGKEKWKGACLGVRTPLLGECVGFGFDADGDITSTLLTVKKGGCQGAGDTSDAACGTKFDEPYCIISTGAPVLCASGTKGTVVTGVARSVCLGDTILLGSLSLSNDWLSEELKKMNVLPKHYLIKSS